MRGGTFGGARLPQFIDDTNDVGFPVTVRDSGKIYVFKYVIPSVKSVGMKRHAKYAEKRCFGKPESLILTQREAYMLQ